MSKNLRVVLAYLTKVSADYLSFTDPKDIAAMSANAPKWIKVLKDGEVRFYPPQGLKILNAEQLGFVGDQGHNLNQQLRSKGYLSLKDKRQVGLMQQMHPDWTKVIRRDEVRFYPPNL
jgi:hypothetical protein